MGGAGSCGEVDGDVALFGERLQQAYDVARERSASAKRWRACRKLRCPIAIDAIGYGVLLASAGDGWACDHQFSAPTAAVNGELHRGTVRTAVRSSLGGNDRRIIHGRRSLPDDPPLPPPPWPTPRPQPTH